jgi:hypothetical protein
MQPARVAVYSPTARIVHISEPTKDVITRRVVYLLDPTILIYW